MENPYMMTIAAEIAYIAGYHRFFPTDAGLDPSRLALWAFEYLAPGNDEEDLFKFTTKKMINDPQFGDLMVKGSLENSVTHILIEQSEGEIRKVSCNTGATTMIATLELNKVEPFPTDLVDLATQKKVIAVYTIDPDQEKRLY